jgi:acetolactate synthase-1/2/3 large subunit
MMNLAVGIAEAYAESVPVLAIVGQVPTTLEGRGGFQDSSGIGRTVDAIGLWRSIAKLVAKVSGASDFWSLLRAAIEAALSGRPGPAVLLIPRDVQALEVPPRPSWFPASLDEMRRAVPITDHASCRRLLERVRTARKPVLVVGTGVDRCSNPRAVRRFAAQTGIPVVTTIASAGAFPNDAPGFLGTIGVAGHPSAHRYLNEEADLIVAAGTGLDVMTRAAIGPGLARATVAVINVDAGSLVRALDPAIVIEADAGLVFEDWLAALAARPFRCAPAPVPPTRIAAVTDAPPDALTASRALALLQPYLPARGHIVVDAGNCAAAALHHLEIPAGVTSTVALGMGGMGYAIAAGTGAQLGSPPGARTLVLCGDGAFLMLGLEIHSAVELALPVLFVVFNNGKHGMCVTRQQLFFDGRTECAEYPPVDIAAIARGLGTADHVWVGSASTVDELAARLAEYHAAPERTGVLELILPYDELPPFTPFLAAGASVSAPLPRAREELAG